MFALIGLDSPHQKISFPITAVLYLEYVQKPPAPSCCHPCTGFTFGLWAGDEAVGTDLGVAHIPAGLGVSPSNRSSFPSSSCEKSTSFLKAEAISGLHKSLVPWQPQSEPNGCCIPGFRQLQSFSSFPYKSSVSGCFMACSALSY